MITKNGKKFGGAQPGAGRKKHEGSRHMYTVADDVHEWIMLHGGGQYLTDMLRAIMHAEALNRRFQWPSFQALGAGCSGEGTGVL